MTFKTQFGETIFNEKYRNAAGNCDTWEDLASTLVNRICLGRMATSDKEQLIQYIKDMKFIPAGRYLYYAGREASYFNNCFAMIAEDTREGWAKLAHNHFMALMCGGGVGTYYGKIRPSNSVVKTTGGIASGPIPLMYAMNECGRQVMQGGARRSALYASLPMDHADINEFMCVKNWDPDVRARKEVDFNSAAPLDMTNISVSYNQLRQLNSRVFEDNLRQAVSTGEPGFQFDFDAPDEVGRNACAEFITDTDSDMCNLGSINMARITNVAEMKSVANLAAQFLYCGSLSSQLPYQECYDIRDYSRKIGLGLMGVHEWILKSGETYGPSQALSEMLTAYMDYSETGADYMSNRLSHSSCKRYRSIAPSGTISLLAGTTSGIEPLFATSIKRRWYDKGAWKYQYVVEPVAKQLHSDGLSIDDMETSFDLAKDVERRLQMQAFMQRYVDMGISSTINLPAWGSEYNNEENIGDKSRYIKKYSGALRGLTFYPDGARGGQPLMECDWDEALKYEGETYYENLKVIEESGCKTGLCGI